MPKLKISRVVIAILVLVSVVTPASADTPLPPTAPIIPPVRSPLVPNDYAIGAFVHINGGDTFGVDIIEWDHDATYGWYATNTTRYGNLLRKYGFVPQNAITGWIYVQIWADNYTSDARLEVKVRNEWTSATVTKEIPVRSLGPGWNVVRIQLTPSELALVKPLNQPYGLAALTAKVFGSGERTVIAVTDVLFGGKYAFWLPGIQHA